MSETARRLVDQLRDFRARKETMAQLLMLGNAAIIEAADVPRETVGVGSRVTVAEGGGATESYRIVGSAEADPGSGSISNVSPLGRALMGRKVGEIAKVNAPDGVLAFEILSIQ